VCQMEFASHQRDAIALIVSIRNQSVTKVHNVPHTLGFAPVLKE